MSDQLFTGIAPTAPAGRECYFASLDTWISICEVIERFLAEDFPFGPTMDARTCASLASILDQAIADGSAAQASSGIAARYFDHEDDPVQARASYAGSLIEEMKKFSTFLQACGGCTAE